MSEDARKLVLKMLQEGKITLEEADQLLAATQGKEAPKAEGKGKKNIFERFAGEVESTVGTIRTGVEAGKMFDSIGKKIGSVVSTVSQAIESGVESVTSSFQDGERFEIQEQMGIPLTEKITQLAITNLKGHVSILGEDRQDISLTLTKVIVATNHEDAEKKARGMVLTPQQAGDRLKLDVPELSRSVFQRESMDLELRIPKGMVPTVASDTGNITVKDLNFGDKEADLKTVSGHLKIEQLTGNVKAQTVSGAITIRQGHGNWQLKTVSGQIELSDVQITGSVNSVSGDLKLSGELDGKLQSQSMSGAFHGELKVSGQSALEVTTTSGAIELHLKDASDAQVTGVSQTGEVTCSASLDGKEVEKNQFKGRAGGGAGQVSLRSTSGAIAVK